ncbi:MAG: hypothetical protein WKF83_13325 [Nocardioidaceae bacterium]
MAGQHLDPEVTLVARGGEQAPVRTRHRLIRPVVDDHEDRLDPRVTTFAGIGERVREHVARRCTCE